MMILRLIAVMAFSLFPLALNCSEPATVAEIKFSLFSRTFNCSEPATVAEESLEVTIDRTVEGQITCFNRSSDKTYMVSLDSNFCEKVMIEFLMPGDSVTFTGVDDSMKVAWLKISTLKIVTDASKVIISTVNPTTKKCKKTIWGRKVVFPPYCVATVSNLDESGEPLMTPRPSPSHAIVDASRLRR